MALNSQSSTSLYYKKCLVFLFIILSLITTLGTLLYFAVSDCSQNCNSYEGNRKPCLNGGSLYCCQVSLPDFLNQQCSTNNGCTFDNDTCGKLIISSGVIGTLILVFIASIIIFSLKSRKPEIETNKNSALIVPFLKDDEKEKQSREDQTTSSSIISIKDVLNLEEKDQIERF